MNVRSSLLWAVVGSLVLSTVRGQDPVQGIPECKEMKTTASGLKWGILTPGDGGESPGLDDQVEVHYTGWLTDGTKFDSSRDRGQPAKFGVTQVIKGWTEGLQLMTPGMRCKFEIPGDLGYGKNGSPPRIPADATLVFDVELIRVIRVPKMRAADPEKQKTLDNGIKVEIVKEGDGAPVEAIKGVTLGYSIWNTEGRNMACTEVLGDRISGMLDKLGSQRLGPTEFLMPLVQNAKVGEIVRAEVPDSAWGRARAATVWEVEVLRVNDVPKFRGLASDQVVTTQSGLKYEVIEAGEGTAPKRTDTVAAFYSGWLTDGTMFDSAHARGEPTEFPLNRVIAGWTEGLQLMKPGAKFLFEIPSELGYGANGSPPTIPANATLIFLVELVEVKPTPPGPQNQRLR